MNIIKTYFNFLMLIWRRASGPVPNLPRVSNPTVATVCTSPPRFLRAQILKTVKINKTKGYLLFSLLTFTQVSLAQIDYNKIILPDDITDSVSLEERLVQIAWRNNPENKVLLKEADIAALEVSRAKVDWTNNIRLSGNLNEYSSRRLLDDISGTVVEEDAIGNRFFPIYNFSVALPLGIFFINPKNTKIARENYGIAQDNIDAQKLTLRATVLTLYQEYVMEKELLEIQTGITENQYAQYLLAKQQFEDGEVTVENFETVQLQYNLQRMNSVRAERNFMTAKLALEEVLGVRLEDIR